MTTLATPMSNSYQHIDNDQALIEACTALQQEDWISIDTEFLREHHYYSELCLVQIGIPDLNLIIDPLSIDDLTPLKNLLHDGSVLKVFHACGQDQELFTHMFDQPAHPVFDTQLAAAVLGYGDQVGYGKLMEQVLSIHLDKAHSRADWKQRPLDKEVMDYAVDDVHYLTQAYPLMLAQLNELGRLSWLSDDFRRIEQAQTFINQPEQQYLKVKGQHLLKRKQLAVLQQLTAWREQQAIRLNQPRKRLISDDVLIDICRRQPKNTQALSKLRGMRESLVKQHGDTIMNLIEQIDAMSPDDFPKPTRKHSLNAEQQTLLEALTTLVYLQAEQHRISSATLCTRKELEKLIHGERDLNVLSGWRLSVVGQTLLDFLAGSGSIRYHNERIVLE